MSQLIKLHCMQSTDQPNFHVQDTEDDGPGSLATGVLVDVDQYVLERNRGLLLRSKSTSELASNRYFTATQVDRRTMSTDRRRIKEESQLEISAAEEEDTPPNLKPKTISAEYGKVLRERLIYNLCLCL